MRVKRIVADLEVAEPGAEAAFYGQLFGLEIAMDQGWIVTLSGPDTQPMQLTLASAGGSGAPVPGLSIEVDDLDTALSRARALGAEPDYGPVLEPWGVRRFFVRDPAGTLVNVLCHET